jgi:hypothetical protein
LKRLLLSAILAGAVQAAYGADIIVDYRDRRVQTAEAAATPAERALLARIMADEAPSALRTEMGPAFVSLGSAVGAFTEPGRRERIYLVQEKRPVAIDPFPNAAAPALVVITEGSPARFFRLPGDVQYQRLVAGVDVDHDGRREVLLESDFINMGSSVTALTAIKLDAARGTATPIQVIKDVFTDSCGGGSPQKGRTAALISRDASGTIVAQRHTLGCR